MNGAIVRARNLHKRFEALEVVCGIDFEIPAGQCFGFLGPNGAGKTTTLRMILGLSTPTGGMLEVFGLPVPARGRTVRQRVGVVPQTDNLDPDFTVVENLRSYAGFFGLGGEVIERRIHELVEFVELTDKADARIDTLSGGMRRRLSIARALINDPELVILDEPTTGLDPQVRHMIWGRLRDLRKAGKTLLLTTHYMEEAERLCDDLVIMDRGRVLDRGSPTQLIAHHVAAEVIEIRGEDGRAEQLLTGLDGMELEHVGDTLYGYTESAVAALERLHGQPDLAYLHRPASLEDVFLRLTGRELRD